MTKKSEARPRLFISYSWSSPEHEQWVVQLATRLLDHGVDVLLDKFDLAPGQDKYAYMERMATDRSLTRILVISDRTYAEKADGRSGGVGTETQILSKEVYERVDQKKVVACVTERDERGEPYLPTFLRNTIYIDFSDPTRESDPYDKLIRNIWGKPEHEKPKIGKRPSYLDDDKRRVLITSTALADVRDALTRGKPYATALLADLALKFVEAYEGEKLPIPLSAPLRSAVQASVDRFLPYKGEFLDLLFLLARFSEDTDHYRRLHSIFEGMLRTQESLAEIGGLQEEWRDNLKFITWEFMLYAVAVFIATEKFRHANTVLQPYLVQSYRFPRPVLVPFAMIDSSMRSIDEPADGRSRLGEFPGSVLLLRKRSSDPRVSFEDLQQADVVLFVRSVLSEREAGRWWYPRTLSLAENQSTFPLFVRAETAEYFGRLQPLLGYTSREHLIKRFEGLSAQDKYPDIPRFWGGAQRYEQLLNLPHLASR